MTRQNTEQKPMSHSDDQPEILGHIDGHAGVITLNRPKALNALSLTIIRGMTTLLTEWKDDPRVSTIIVQGSGDKAFCAGGDIRSVYEAHLRGEHAFMSDIFQEEYLLNFLIHIYPKPYISLIDGIAMGGGMGISIHGSHRIVTERTIMAMPETSIGFFPDVGASHFLNKCPGEIGTFLGVLGERITGEDALYTGLATHRVASSEIPDVFKALTKAQSFEEVDTVLQDAAGGQSDCFLQTHRNLIDQCFWQSSLEGILEALSQESDPIVTQWLKAIDKKSPLSLKVTLAALRRTKNKSLKQVLAQDYILSQHFVAGHDFFEGIRALLIDKDQNPRWQPARLEEVTPEMVEGYFLERI